MSILSEIDNINTAKTKLAESLVNSLGVEEKDIINSSGNVVEPGLYSTNSDGTKGTIKRIQEWSNAVNMAPVKFITDITYNSSTSKLQYSKKGSTTDILTLSKSTVGLGNVENTRLSTWKGSSDITTLGTISTGTWKGTKISDSYISSASNWNAAYGWGDHSQAGYLKSHQSLVDYVKKVTIANNTTNDFNTFDNLTFTGRADPTDGASLVNAPWTGRGPAGGYGTLTYLWGQTNAYGIQLAWGYGNTGEFYIRNKYYVDKANKWSTTWYKLARTIDIPTNVSLLTNDSSFVTGSVSGNTITINGTSTTWTNTWRPIGTGATDAAAGNHTHSTVTGTSNGFVKAPNTSNVNSIRVTDSYYIYGISSATGTPTWYKLPANAFSNDNTTSFTITAGSTDGIFDITGTSGTNSVSYSVAPYTTAGAGHFDTSSTNPTGTTRLNWGGYLYATKLYSNGSAVLTSHQSLSGYVNNVTTSGSGNAVTSITKTGSTITVTNGSTFSLSGHTHSNYLTTSSISDWAKASTKPSYSWSEITGNFPVASTTSVGGIKTNYTNSGKNYKVQLDANNNAYVNVPWTDTNTNTHYTTHLYVGAINTNKSEITTNGDTYLKLYDDSTKRELYKITGSGGTTVASDASGNITISSTAVTKDNVGLSNVQNTAFYAKIASVNGFSWNMAGTTSGAAFTIYAPTTVGSAGLVLVSQGTGAPVWLTPTIADISSPSLLISNGTDTSKCVLLGSSVLSGNWTSASCTFRFSGIESWWSGILYVGFRTNGSTAAWDGNQGVSGNAYWDALTDNDFSSNVIVTNEANAANKSFTVRVYLKLTKANTKTLITLLEKTTLSQNIATFTVGNSTLISTSAIVGTRIITSKNLVQNNINSVSSTALAAMTTVSLAVTAESNWRKLIFTSGGASTATADVSGNTNNVYYSQKLAVQPSTGSIRTLGSMYANAFYTNSDIRYKRIIENINLTAQDISKIPLFKYTWNSENLIKAGTSAQATAAIIPELLGYDSARDFYSIDYSVLGTISGVTACKELTKLELRILELERLVKDLQDKLIKLNIK